MEGRRIVRSVRLRLNSAQLKLVLSLAISRRVNSGISAVASIGKLFIKQSKPHGAECINYGYIEVHTVAGQQVAFYQDLTQH